MPNDEMLDRFFQRVEKQVEFGDSTLVVWVNPNLQKDLGWKEDLSPEENEIFVERAVKIVYAFSDETMAKIDAFQYRGVLYDKFIEARNKYFEGLRNFTKPGSKPGETQ